MVSRLVIGSRNRCPWSLSAWLAMRMFDLAFEEVLVPLDRPESQALLQRFSPSAKVPALIEGALTIWDSLAILEHLAERRPGMWPKGAAERAVARSVAAEVHGGFSAVHRFLPMDLVARFAPPGRLMRAVAADLKRIRRIWIECRASTPSEAGPFLFGNFSIVDALFAPIATQFVTYSLPPGDPTCAAYVTTMINLSAMHEWAAEAASEVAAFQKIPAAPFHRSTSPPIELPNELLAKESHAENASRWRALSGNANGGQAVPMTAAITTQGGGEDDRKAREGIERADRGFQPRPALNSVEKPMIAYLDEPTPGKPRAQSSPVDVPVSAITSTDKVHDALPASAYLDHSEKRRGGPAPAASRVESRVGTPAADVPPQPLADRTRMPVGEVSRPSGNIPSDAHDPDPILGGRDDQATFGAPDSPIGKHPTRLGRPGVALAKASASPANRFARALTGSRERPAEPAGSGPAKPADQPDFSGPHHLMNGMDDWADRHRGTTQQPAEADAKDPPPSTRSPAIKPIGFSTNRRR